jgi:N-carbamoyl-L-amino-acid hydrolase
VIPGEVRLDLELRGTADSLLNAAESDLRGAALEAGGTVDRLSAKPRQRFGADIRASIEAACEAAAVDHQALWSGAGHDAGVLATAVDAAMIFVPSKGGISHSPAEFTESADCLTGANVLLQSVIALDSELDRAQT